MPRRQRLSPSRAAAALLVALPVLAGCSGPVTVRAAEDGGSQACTDVVRALPSSLAGQPRRDTTGGPGTAAWGDPAILLRCGEEVVVVSSEPCVGVPTEDGEVDWVVLASDETGSIVRTFGRDPAVEVEVPGAYGPAPVSVLPDLGEAVQVVPADAVCIE